MSQLSLHLARHGETAWNAQNKLQGHTDIPLNATGRSQAERLARELRPVPLAHIYCSTLQRSWQTAETLAGRAPITRLDELRERQLGAFEGQRLVDELAREYARRRSDPDDDLGGGESMDEHFARVRGAVEQILQAHPTGDILVVGHGATNAQILRSLLGIAGDEACRIRQRNDELYLLVRHEDAWTWKQRRLG